jgi:hypothetical protein
MPATAGPPRIIFPREAPTPFACTQKVVSIDCFWFQWVFLLVDWKRDVRWRAKNVLWVCGKECVCFVRSSFLPLLSNLIHISGE